MEKVSVVKCKDYNKKELKAVLHKCMKNIGGLGKYIRPDDKVLIKPNLLLAAQPEKGVTTHPVFLEALIELLSSFTDRSRIIIADSPGAGIPYNTENLEKVYKTTGILQMAERIGCILNFDTTYKSYSLKEGNIIKQVDVIKPYFEADKIINVPKFKTHDLMSLTGAVKNMFGLIPGFEKIGHHLRFTQLDNFAEMLLDIALNLKPTINIMDGILGIEGDGPGMSGTLREIGIVMASRNAISMDALSAHFVRLDSQLFPLLKIAQKNGMQEAYLENIEIIGDVKKDFKISNFVLPKGIGRKDLISNKFINTYLMPWVRNSLNPYPYVINKKCTLCGTCQKVCPYNAINIRKDKVQFDYNKCLRCFCCSELCPEGAINIKYSWIGNLLFNRFGLAGKKSK